MDFLVAIGTKMAESMVEPVGNWLCYSFQYSSNINKLKIRVEELQDARERVQHSVTAARDICEEIESDVNRWLTKVDEITRDAREVLEREEGAKLRFSNGGCLNFKSRHQLSQNAKQIVQGIDEVLEKGSFDRVSYRPALHSVMIAPYTNYTTFESRKQTVVELLEALKDANANLIGVWGMGGVGKTTLVRDIAIRAKEGMLFDKVAMADVTESPDIRHIQGEIADMLHLKFEEETERGRANRLREKFTKEKKILVILDNIWKTLDLEEIGIPCQGCKAVLISRNRDVLCQIGTQKDFGLEVLHEEEAWNLFETMVGDSVKDPDVRSVATEVAKECAGLPIALVAVSKALKNKSLCEWNDALQQLRTPAPGHLTEMQSTIYSTIELTYRHLESQEAQYFFLLCAEMSPTIQFSDLLKYCYGLGLFHGIKTLEEARNKIQRLLRYLRDSCLLLNCSPLLDCPRRSEHCHMHDVVRDVGRLIGSKDHIMVLMKGNERLQEWQEVDVFERCKVLTIDSGDIQHLNEMRFPELRLFHAYAYGRRCSLQIPDTLFQGMEKLKVLDFTNLRFSSLPPSLLILRNLRTLCIDYCKLEDIAIIGQLKDLAVLSLRGCNISHLPREIGWLTRLQSLDLGKCSKLEVIPPNVLSSLVALEELFMKKTSIQWGVEGLNKRSNANLAELKYLSHLITLEIHIRDANNLPKDLLLGKLERFTIYVGDVWDWSERPKTSRTLKLKINTRFQSKVWIKILLKKTENLFLHELKGVNNVVPELDGEGFQRLKHLQIQENFEIKYIIDSRTSIIAFPTLETLSLKNMINMEEICHGQLPSTSFGRLSVIKMEGCHKLKFFIPSSIASGLPLLEELEINECSNIIVVVLKEEGGMEVGHMTWFPKLRCLALNHIPKLKSFLGTKNSFAADDTEIILDGKRDFHMPILHEEVVLPKFGKSDLPLKDIRDNQHQAKCIGRLTNMLITSKFQNLSLLNVEGNDNIEHLLSFSMAESMVLLKHLCISKCNVMEEILLTEALGVEEQTIHKILFPRLERLYLNCLPVLKRFCMGNNIKFPFLRELKVKHCARLKTFVEEPASSSMKTGKELKQIDVGESSHTTPKPFFSEVVAFPSLEILEISNMVDLKIIWQNQFVIDSFCKLQFIEIEHCENLTSIFQSDVLVRFQSLEELFVTDCGSLQEVFELQGLNVVELHAVTPIRLKILALFHLPKLRHVWNKDPHPFFSFQNLQQVYAVECENLKNLFPASVGGSLMQLERLVIVQCGVEEIVAREETAEAIAGVVFPQVTLLHLAELPRLERFYPGVHTSEWPKLKEICVQGCPFLCVPSSLEETLQECQHEICNKQLHLLFDKDQVKWIESCNAASWEVWKDWNMRKFNDFS